MQTRQYDPTSSFVQYRAKSSVTEWAALPLKLKIRVLDFDDR